MSQPPNILVDAFHRPSGLLGAVAGSIMTRTNAPIAAWSVERLEPGPTHRILEVGFGPGLALEQLARLAGQVDGVEVSELMYRRAHRRNRAALAAGRLHLHRAPVEALPFDDGAFDAVLAINSFQAWDDRRAGLAEIQRVLVAGGRLVLGFNPHARQTGDAVRDAVCEAGFERVSVEHQGPDFCVLAYRPA